ncbi:hypothetical protein S40293_01356 [Stachybotrys chartarum IBT 40293]|nr:hypothetical protein S40293_01356 [Stachybotrys chartarum IBT 40293]
MATIEPRLIHLLNESTTPQMGHADLPALHALPQPASPERSLPPLQLEAFQRFDNARSIELTTTHGFSHTVSDFTSPLKHMHDGSSRYAGNHLSYPIRPVWADSEPPEQSYASARGRDDGHDLSDDSIQRKRVRGLGAKEDFVQLPQPIKKQKAAQQSLAMPPIINGLHEPPPHAALFPPISSCSFEDPDPSNSQQLLHDFKHTPDRRHSKQSSPETDKYASKVRKRAAKPRRKWSEAETKHLLLGVNRHGVGKWTSILEDPDFSFNDRTAGDLKDRFRTCCPDELRASNRGLHADSPPSPAPESLPKTKTGISPENILAEEAESPPSDTAAAAAASSQQDTTCSSTQKKSRAHRKKMTDLAELGIHGPFKKSHRRERRPFTDHDDREILEGLDIYGPAWTKIQRDTRFGFSSRQPTDLRDRVRNKYPEIYQKIEKGTFQPGDGSRGNSLLEPSVTMSIGNSLQRAKVTALEPQMQSSNKHEELPRWSLQSHDLSDNHSLSRGFDNKEGSAFHHPGGEMGISRLLLDDAYMSRRPSR